MLFKMIRTHAPSKQKLMLLDIGGYKGDLLASIASSDRAFTKKLRYYIVDTNKKALTIAKKRKIKTTYADLNIKRLNKIYSQKFDIIVLSEILEHLMKPQELLQDVIQLIDNESLIIFSMPNENTLYHRLISLLGYGQDQNAYALYGKHKHYHSPSILQNRQLVKKHFTITEEKYYADFNNPTIHNSLFSVAVRLIPTSVLTRLANSIPSLFARGVLFAAKLK